MRAWIEREVTVTGEIEQRHLRPWSTAMWVPTADGPVWFKAAREAFAYEARILQVLAPLAPDILPEVVAARPEAGWLLVRDAGRRAREHPIEWAPLLRRYAELQIASIPHAQALLAAGIVDNREPAVERLFQYLSAAIAERLRARMPEVEERLARLAASPLPATVEHNDLHDGNVFLCGGRARILDWGDAALAHPLFTLTVEEDTAARGAYLEPWAELYPRERLLADVEDVLALRYLLRAVTWDRLIGLDATAAARIEERVVLFLGASSER
ncbi:MAG: phosphotransferase family protein [Gaiellaceae bacterium]